MCIGYGPSSHTYISIFVLSLYTYRGITTQGQPIHVGEGNSLFQSLLESRARETEHFAGVLEDRVHDVVEVSKGMIPFDT